MSDNMVTFNGVQVPEADVLKAAERIKAEREKPKPVEPGLYRRICTTDTNPFVNGYSLLRKSTDGEWHYTWEWGDKLKQCSRPMQFIDEDVRNGLLVPLQPVEGVEYEGGDGYRRRWCGEWQFVSRFGDGWLPSSDGNRLWRTGQLRPVQSQPWTPKEGEWVQHRLQPWDKVRLVQHVRPDDWSGETTVTLVDKTKWYASDICPATPEEITAAKRIEVKDRLIVRCKADGGVWHYFHSERCWIRLDALGYVSRLSNLDLTLDHYDILPEYTVQGAQR